MYIEWGAILFLRYSYFIMQPVSVINIMSIQYLRTLNPMKYEF